MTLFDRKEPRHFNLLALFDGQAFWPSNIFSLPPTLPTPNSKRQTGIRSRLVSQAFSTSWANIRGSFSNPHDPDSVTDPFFVHAIRPLA